MEQQRILMPSSDSLNLNLNDERAKPVHLRLQHEALKFILVQFIN